MNLTQLMEKASEMQVDDRRCTQALLKEWQDTLPLFRKKILINCHFTIATLMLIEIFLFSGAELKVTCTNDLVCHDSIKEIILNLGIYLSPEEVHQEAYKHHFDVVLDCGAYLANTLKPTIGFIELTYVERSSYILTSCPVISVDNGFIKKIETSYGTGDGFIRAIKEIYQKNKKNYREKTYMVFGYGKVGQGISSCLVNTGVSQSNVIIIETDSAQKELAALDGFNSFTVPNELEIIKKMLHTTDCVITATGVINSISNHLSYEDFSAVEHLVNMGTHDEWGDTFPQSAILNNKRPLNFMLDYPTQICYLDPIFAVLAYATLDIINENVVKQFMIKKPSLSTERKVLQAWLQNSNIHQNMKERWLYELESYV